MKLLFILIFTFVIFNGNLFSQEQYVKRSQIKTEEIIRGADTLQVKLNLTEEQKIKLIGINTDLKNQLDILGDFDPSNKLQGEKRNQLFTTRELKLQEILTPEQYKKYKEYVQERQQKIKKAD